MAKQQLDPATRAEQVAEIARLAASGMSTRSIGERVGLSHVTVQHRLNEYAKDFPAPDVATLRLTMREQIDAAIEKAMKIVETTEDAELQLKAMATVVRLQDRLAKLFGIDAPIQVAPITVQTQTEAWLESQFAAIDAGNAVRMEQLAARTE